METIFTCNAHEEERTRSEKKKVNIWCWILGAYIILFSFYIYLFYLSSQDGKDLGYRIKGGFVLIIFILYTSIKKITKNRYLYKHFDGKKFTINVSTKTFHYTDGKKDITFISEDISNWYISHNDETYRKIPPFSEYDELWLKNGETIKLEDIFNNDVHPFLLQHREELSLPEPRVMNYRD